MTGAPLAELLQRPSLEVAPQLLGAVLHGRGVSLRITEVEAYLGELDPGSHAFRGLTRRNAVMYGPPGRLYVYFTYGMHVCANVTVCQSGEASAVLLRAGEIVNGLDLARSRRPSSKSDRDLARGPARLTRALGIELADNGESLSRGPIRLEIPPEPVEARLVSQGPRTGVSGEGGSDRYPWRFWIDGDPTVSPYKKHVPKRR